MLSLRFAGSEAELSAIGRFTLDKDGAEPR